MVLLASHASPYTPKLPQLFSTFTSGQRGVCAICLLIYALFSSNLCVEQAKASATPTSQQCRLLLLLLLLLMLLLCCSNFMNYCWLIRLLARRDMALPPHSLLNVFSVCVSFFTSGKKWWGRGSREGDREREQRGKERKGEGNGVGLDGLVSLDVTRSGNCVRRE